MRTSHGSPSISPDPCPDLAVERGPDGKGVGSWVPTQKHRLLPEYLNASCHAWRKWPSRVFIDPFSGPGRIQVAGESVTRDGGAVVAYRALAEKQAPFTRMLVGDLAKDRALACESCMRSRTARRFSHYSRIALKMGCSCSTSPRPHSRRDVSSRSSASCINWLR
jgi:hypothetical protein